MNKWHKLVLLAMMVISTGALATESMVQLARLTESDGQADNTLGDAVGIDGNAVVVGDEAAPGYSNPNTGAVYVFVKPAGGWQTMTQTAKLTASDGLRGDSFGAAVAIRGDTIVVGAYNHASGTKQFGGAIYVFVKPASGWVDMTETAELTVSNDDSEIGVFLGRGVAIDGSGTTVYGGAPAAGTSGNGALFVFSKPSSGWVNGNQNAELISSDGDAISLGGPMAASGNTVVSGAQNWPNAGTIDCCLGAAYVWVKPPNGWTNMAETARLTSWDSADGDELGESIAMDANTIVVGALGHTVNGYLEGAAYIFEEPRGGWKTTSQFSARLSGQGITPGVAVSGTKIIAGSAGYDNDEGAAYLYVAPATGWSTTTDYNAFASDPAAQSFALFGSFEAEQGNLSVIGAYLEKPAGAAYVYEVEP
jgi:hypothetical protein